MSTKRNKLLLVAPRPPRVDGQGDQRRAAEAVEALTPEWDIDVLSWLPDVGAGGRPILRPPVLLRIMLLALRSPVTVAYVQAMAPRTVRRRIRQTADTEVLFLTDRVVPRRTPPRFSVDFVDDLGGAALRRAAGMRGPASLFWKLEGRRLRRYDCRLAARARRAIACSPVDADGIGSPVVVVPLSVTPRPVPQEGDAVAFLGNLFYYPNIDAAQWICEQLVPELARLGISPDRILIAGRRPPAEVVEAALRAGVRLLPDVPDPAEVHRQAAVEIAPIQLGSGTQMKVLDAIGAGRPCVITELVNRSLALVDGRSAVVCAREPKLFAEAIVSLLDDPAKRTRMAEAAHRELSRFAPEEVAKAWREVMR